MIGRWVSKAALAAAFVFSVTAPSSALPASDASLLTGDLPGGGRYEIDPSQGAPVAAVALWYRAPAGGFDTSGIPGLARLAAATVSGSAPITGTPLGRYVEELGGRIAISVYPNSVSISALVPAESAAAVVHAMTVSYFAPVVTAKGLELAQRDVAEEAFFRQFNPEAGIEDSLLSALYGEGVDHVSTLGPASSINKITIEQVRSFAQRAFRPANAVLVVTGAVDANVVATAVPGQAQSSALPEPPLDVHGVAQPAPIQTVGTEPGIGLGWMGPTIANEREATALDFVADYLFRDETGLVQHAVAPTKATVSGKFVTYHDPGVLLVSISGGDVSAARAVVDAALRSAQKPLNKEAFNAARSAFMYHMLSDIETPGGIADTLGWYAVEGNARYAPGADGASGAYFAAANSLTPKFVADTVAKYLSRPGAVVTVDVKTPQRTQP